MGDEVTVREAVVSFVTAVTWGGPRGGVTPSLERGGRT